jgi:hypothetical protein
MVTKVFTEAVTKASRMAPLLSSMFSLLFPAVLLVSAGSTLQARIAEAQPQGRAGASHLDEQLTDVGEKLYELNVRVPSLFMQAFREEGAGEGLSSRLFSDPIAVFELALEKNERNGRARFLLAKCYFAKSRRGEGRWSRVLLAKAEQDFRRVLTEPRKSGLTPKQLAEARQALEDIRKIREGQGEMVD